MPWMICSTAIGSPGGSQRCACRRGPSATSTLNVLVFTFGITSECDLKKIGSRIMPAPALLAIDQGTTSTRAIVCDRRGDKLGVAQLELPQSYPKPGWVEHDPVRIWDDTLKVVRSALKSAKLRVRDITAIGITNQRETSV